MTRTWICPKHGSVAKEGEDQQVDFHRMQEGCVEILELKEAF